MCTREEGRLLGETYRKYLEERLADPEDMGFLDILADARRIEYVYRRDGIYARAVRLRGADLRGFHPHCRKPQLVG